MNKPTKIQPPKPGEKASGTSLFERASGVFGLDKLGPAKPGKPLPVDAAPRMPKPKREPEVAKPAAAAMGMADPADEVIEDHERDAPRRRKRASGGAAVPLPTHRHKVSRDHLRSLGMIDPDMGSSTLLEEFRIVKRQVLATADADGSANSRRILVCSPHPNEGKTFCATNLALALAGEKDVEVVLVDGDFGKPSVMSTFGLKEGKGFMDALRDPEAHVEDFVVATDIDGLWLLPAGKRTGSDAEYLASERTWGVLNRLTRGAANRFVIFDSPPALAASPAAELAKHVGQALLVARADETSRAALEDAVDLLAGCEDIRLLLNDATFSPSGRKFGQYYGYGE